MGRILQLNKPLLLVSLCFLANYVLRLPHLFSLGYLNDDAGMILHATKFIEENGLFAPFFSSLQAGGPALFRPFQMITFYFEYQLFGTEPFPSHLISIIWLSIGQAIGILTLTPYIGALGAIVALLPTSLSLVAAEPTLWLSDRHDLYLLVCLMLSLRWSLRALHEDQSRFKSFVLLSLITWAGFFCNEKATAIPFITALIAFPLFRLKYPSHTFLTGRVAGLIQCGVIHVALYLWLRYFLFGRVIGGYDDTLLLDQQIDLQLVFTWVTTLFTIPFQQIHPSDYRIASSLVALSVGSLLFFIRGASFVRLVIFFFVALLLSSIPTARMAHEPLHAVANGRLFWLPLITASLFFGSLFGESLYQSKKTWLHITIALILLSPALYAGRNALQRVRKATDYSNDVIAEYRKFCGCVDMFARDVRKLPPFYRTVNTFTEPTWIKSTALFLGHPKCTEPDPCVLKAKKGTPPLTPIKISPSVLAAKENALFDIHSH